MASIRIGIKSEFNLVDSKVGVGTTNPTETMDVRGQIYSDNSIGAGGISTVTTYQGFLDTKQIIKSSSEGTVVAGTLSGEIIIDGNVTVSSGTTYTSGLSELTATNKFTLPGITGSRPTEGTTRFNENLAALEFYTGTEWRAVNSIVDMGNRGRGVYVGGSSYPVGPLSSTIDYIEIATQGNAQDFGNLTAAREGMGMGTISSAIRGLAMAGWTGSASDIIEYITLASGGNSIDFGNSTQARAWGAGMSSSTRGLCAGGYSPSTVNTIDFVEIMTLGDAVDFGDLPSVKESTVGMSSPTRGIVGTGMSPSFDRDIDYLTMASKGNALVFGELSSIRGLGAAANTTTGLFAGGKGPDQQNLNIIYKITIASTGSQTEFGTLSTGARKPAGVSNSTRACFAGGEETPTPRITTIQSVSFSSGGTTEFFGDLTEARNSINCSSDSHGGLGGF